MSEAGNYGDDLISLAVVQAIEHAIPEVEVHHLSFGQPLVWDEYRTSLGLRNVPFPVKPDRDLPGTSVGSRAFQEMDALVFGGGGLLQSTHHADRPYHWLRYLPSDPTIPVLAAGLGVGPLRSSWLRKLHVLGQPFNECFVRDELSQNLTNEVLGWNAELCSDFVDEEFLKQLIPSGLDAGGSRILGVALRAWPGIDANRVAQHIATVTTEHSIDEIRFFVLEANRGRGDDVVFSRSVMTQLRGTRTSLYVYEPRSLTGFTELMASCNVAISMKLHASAVWAAVDLPIYPIVYAPKIAAFFGLEYKGPQIHERVVEPLSRPRAWPRAEEVLEMRLPALLAEQTSDRAVMSESFRLQHQTSSLLRNAISKAGRTLSPFGGK